MGQLIRCCIVLWWKVAVRSGYYINGSNLVNERMDITIRVTSENHYDFFHFLRRLHISSHPQPPDEPPTRMHGASYPEEEEDSARQLLTKLTLQADVLFCLLQMINGAIHQK